MDVASGLALLLLTLLGYSYGSVLACRRRGASPTIVDLPTTALLCAGALMSRALLGRWWAILAWLLAGAVAGVATAALRRAMLPIAARAPPSPSSGALPARLGREWGSITRGAGDFQARLVLLWFYIAIVTPVGLLYRLGGDPLSMRSRRGGSSWHKREPSSGGLDDARRQF
jgi:hypothetical protein